MSPTTKQTNWGRLADQAAEADQRQRAIDDPGGYHGDIAASELHWFDHGVWLRRDPDTGEWAGYHAADGTAVGEGERGADWRPWTQAFDDSEAPFFRWFVGAQTNACFNGVDRHVLGGRGPHAAFRFEGDRWDPSRNDGRRVGSSQSPRLPPTDDRSPNRYDQRSGRGNKSLPQRPT